MLFVPFTDTLFEMNKRMTKERYDVIIGKWSELRKSERRKPKRTPKIDFRRSDLL
jgi:hypothetical protein